MAPIGVTVPQLSDWPRPLVTAGPTERRAAEAGPPPSSLVETLDWRATSGDERPVGSFKSRCVAWRPPG